MGDMGDTFRAMREHRQKKHQDWNRRNTSIIGESGIPYLDRGETFCFREAGQPMVDFYPSTGRWRVVGAEAENYKRGAFSGGARKFLKWYEKQKG